VKKKKELLIVIGVALLGTIIVSLVPNDAGPTMGWLALAFLVAAVWCIIWRIFSGRGLATTLVMVTAVFFWFEFSQWAWYYK
jgi:predicted membrane protein